MSPASASHRPNQPSRGPLVHPPESAPPDGPADRGGEASDPAGTGERAATDAGNIAARLRWHAARNPHRGAVIVPAVRDRDGQYAYRHWTYQDLERNSDRLARGLDRLGVRPGMRIVLMVPFGLEFVALTFALLKVGAVAVLIDPGMGRRNIFRCLKHVDPEGFIGVPIVHWLRRLYRRHFPNARVLVTLGKRAVGGVTFRQLLGEPWQEPFSIAPTDGNGPAAIIFTSGSTGPPKGVVYRHRMFAAQVEMLQQRFGIRPGEVDLAGFPLFALFDPAMGTTLVVPDMDPTRPAEVDPPRILQHMADHAVTYAFGSPALWNRVGWWCARNGVRFPVTVRRLFSAGAPVPVDVLERLCAALSDSQAEVYTPYGATEALPVSVITAREVLSHTAQRSAAGAGTCVGRPFDQVQVRVIAIGEEPVGSFADTAVLPPSQIGEIVVSGPSVTEEYFRDPQATARAKIVDGQTVWHRMGDVGYLDEDGRLWFCGRKSHIVWTADGPLFTVPCETIVNQHPAVFRSALVGVGERGAQVPVIVIEPEAESRPRGRRAADVLRGEILQWAARHPLTRPIRHCLIHPSFPVDIRHNSKIFRERLAEWAARRLSGS